MTWLKPFRLVACSWVLLVLFTPCSFAQPEPTPDLSEEKELIQTLGVEPDGPSLLRFFRNRILNDTPPETIQLWIKQLGAEEFAVRQQASSHLVQVGLAARNLLSNAVRNPDVEVRRRAIQCLKQIDEANGPSFLAAAVKLLGHLRPEGSLDVLLDFAPITNEEMVLDEVGPALASIARENELFRRELLGALSAPEPIRRAVAGEALWLIELDESKTHARKLLADKDPRVRTRLAYQMLASNEKEAIPILVGLMGELPPDQLWRIEDTLFRIARETSPEATVGTTLASRKQAQEEWKAWWAKHGEGLDLEKINSPMKMQGFTLIAERKSPNGSIVEVDARGAVRWQFQTTGRSPVSAEVLPNQRVLVADYYEKSIKEYDTKGKVHWSKTLPAYVLHAERLPNGHTFVATNNQLIQVNAEGKEVISVRTPGLIRAADRLPNGHFAVIDSTGNYSRITPAGKTVASFPADRVYSIGSSIEVLPQGNTIVPGYYTSQVTEFNSRGKVVWQVNIPRPSCVKRLSNGNTLIGSRTGPTVMEVNREGKVVWQHTGVPWVTFVSRR